MRVVNRRLKGRLPPIQLPPELRRKLGKAAAANRPVINSMTMSNPGVRPPSSPPPVRPCMALGTCEGYLDAVELQGELDGMADRYFRLERLYLARKGEGLTEDNDEGTKAIRDSLGNMGSICQLLDALVHTKGLVAMGVLTPSREICAAADRVLQAHSAYASSSEAVH